MMMMIMIVMIMIVISRCTFSTDKSLASQEMADAVLFHMPNFHWDKWVVRQHFISEEY